MTQGQSGGPPRPAIVVSPRARALARGGALVLVGAFILLAGAVLIAAARLPSLAKLNDGQAGIKLAALPAYAPKAFIVTEDQWFYWHPGFNPWGMARSQIYNLGHVGQDVPLRGGSTITQQVARNLFLSREQTLGRKAQELILAMAMEVRYSKHDILALYLNRTDFGGGAIGIEAASQHYFGHPASRLSVSQTALLAGVLKGTDRCSPVTNPARAQQRAELILANMEKRGVITAGQRDEAVGDLAMLGTTQLAQARPRPAPQALARAPVEARSWRVKLSDKVEATSECALKRLHAKASTAKRRTLAKARDILPGDARSLRVSLRRWVTQWTALGIDSGPGRARPNQASHDI